MAERRRSSRGEIAAWTAFFAVWGFVVAFLVHAALVIT